MHVINTAKEEETNPTQLRGQQLGNKLSEFHDDLFEKCDFKSQNPKALQYVNYIKIKLFISKLLALTRMRSFFGFVCGVQLPWLHYLFLPLVTLFITSKVYTIDNLIQFVSQQIILKCYKCCCNAVFTSQYMYLCSTKFKKYIDYLQGSFVKAFQQSSFFNTTYAQVLLEDLFPEALCIFLRSATCIRPCFTLDQPCGGDKYNVHLTRSRVSIYDNSHSTLSSQYQIVLCIVMGITKGCYLSVST